MELKTEADLRALYGTPKPRTVAKEIDHIDHHCRRFIALSPFFLLATSDGTRLDISPKGDAPGAVIVADDKTLLLPDWPGNKRIDGLLNIVRQPQVGLIFLIPNVKETLRVNGRASIHDDPDLAARFDKNGKRPLTVTQIAVEEVFVHCAKALIRSDLWDAATWPDRAALPTLAEMIRDHAELTETPVYPSDEEMKRSGELF